VGSFMFPSSLLDDLPVVGGGVRLEPDGGASHILDVVPCHVVDLVAAVRREGDVVDGRVVATVDRDDDVSTTDGGTYTPTAGVPTNVVGNATFAPPSGNPSFQAYQLNYTVSPGSISGGQVNGLVVNATENAPFYNTHNLLNLQTSGVTRLFVFRNGSIGIIQANIAGIATSQLTALTINLGTASGISAGNEVPAVNINANTTKQWNTGSISVQREFLIQASTYSFVAASTITNAATLGITGPPTAGTNATITNSFALWVQSGSSQFIPTKTVASAAGAFWNGLDIAAATLTLTGAVTPVTTLSFVNVGQPTVTAASASTASSHSGCAISFAFG